LSADPAYLAGLRKERANAVSTQNHKKLDLIDQEIARVGGDVPDRSPAPRKAKAQ
jgi:hypothetical protein